MFALRNNELLFYNVGNGQPYTVLEIVEVAKRVSGRKIAVKMAPRRPGDRSTGTRCDCWYPVMKP